MGEVNLKSILICNSHIWILYDNFQSAVWINNYIIEQRFESGDVQHPYVRPGTIGCATEFKKSTNPPLF